MLDTPTNLLLMLFAVGGVAGFVDAIAGGGGLLTLPSLLLADLAPHLALGTNKAQGVFGTATALLRFSFSPLLDRERAIVSFPTGLLGAACGVWLVRHVAPERLTPLVALLLAGAALFIMLYRPYTAAGACRRRSAMLAIVVAFLIALYDGFFGPGTGTFLIVAYVWFWHDSADAASANAKVVNMASNLGSAAYFAYCGLVCWKLALPMAAGQVIGGIAGAHVTVRSGSIVVRYAVVFVSLVLIARLLWRFAVTGNS